MRTRPLQNFFGHYREYHPWTPLDAVDSSKYLRDTISKDLRWDNHINTITSKANKTLGFIRRNMRGCRTSARAAAYQGLVRPHLEYACSASWTSTNIQQIKVQRRAARFATRTYHDRHPGSVTHMIQDLNRKPYRLENSRSGLLFSVRSNII
jgi:hypothetical protein